VVFDNLAVFTGAAFGDATKFDDSVFNGWALFNGESKEKRTAELGASPELGVRHQEAWNGPDRFLSISFSGVRFHGEVNFSGRSFERTADFTNTQFLFRNFPPDFDSATNLSRIDFAGAHTGAGPLHFFRLTYDPRVVNRIRALRKAAEEDRNHDLEHGLFMEERKAQRGLSCGQPLEALKTGSCRNWPRNTAQLIANFPGSSLCARRLWPQFCAPIPVLARLEPCYLSLVV